MTIKKLLLQEIESAPDTLLSETLDFLRFLKTKDTQIDSVTTLDPATPNSPQPLDLEATPIIRGSTAGDLLKFAGTWQGDDFEECLQLVYDTRSQAEF